MKPKLGIQVDSNKFIFKDKIMFLFNLDLHVTGMHVMKVDVIFQY